MSRSVRRGKNKNLPLFFFQSGAKLDLQKRNRAETDAKPMLFCKVHSSPNRSLVAGERAALTNDRREEGSLFVAIYYYGREGFRKSHDSRQMTSLDSFPLFWVGRSNLRPGSTTASHRGLFPRSNRTAGSHRFLKSLRCGGPAMRRNTSCKRTT
jgi:hypothetical protein